MSTTVPTSLFAAHPLVPSPTRSFSKQKLSISAHCTHLPVRSRPSARPPTCSRALPNRWRAPRSCAIPTRSLHPHPFVPGSHLFVPSPSVCAPSVRFAWFPIFADL